MTGRNSLRPDPAASSRRSWKDVCGLRGSLVGFLAATLAAACGATLALGAPAMARPLEDEEPDGPRVVLGGRASLDRGELTEGGWSIVTEAPDRLVLVAGAARVRIIVDAALGPTAGAPGSLVAALSDAAGLATPKYVTRPVGAFAVFDAEPSSAIATGLEAPRPDPTASGCTALPWQVANLTGVTLTGEGDAKVVLGTPCTVERAYVVTRGSGNLLVEAQAPLGTDNGKASLDAMDALVMTLVPAGARIDDDLSPLGYKHR